MDAPAGGSVSFVPAVLAAARARTRGRVAASRVSPPNPLSQDTTYGLAGALDCRVVSTLGSVRAKKKKRQKAGSGLFWVPSRDLE